MIAAAHRRKPLPAAQRLTCIACGHAMRDAGRHDDEARDLGHRPIPEREQNAYAKQGKRGR